MASPGPQKTERRAFYCKGGNNGRRAGILHEDGENVQWPRCIRIEDGCVQIHQGTACTH